MKKLKLFALALTALFATGVWADEASWTFETDATGLTIADAGSASTERAQYSSTGSSWTDASGSYCLYANLGSTKGSSTTVTTTSSYDNITEISLKLGTSDRGKTEFALQVSPEADFSSDVTNVQARVTIKDNISTMTANTRMYDIEYTIATPVSGYVRITLAQASGSNNKKMIVDDLNITYTPNAGNTPIASVTVEGPTAAYIGVPVTFTAKTDVTANAYKWYVDGVEQSGKTAKTFEFTPTANVTYSIKAAAKNDNNTDYVVSTAVGVTASKLCGELIKATLKGGTNADMSGVVSGSFDTNLGSGNFKLDKGKYIGVKLASGTFQAGDVVTIEMSAAGQNYPCLFGDKDRKTVLFLATEASTATSYEITLPAAANGLTSIYLSRESTDEGATYKWNPTVSSISVFRSCEDSNDASIHSLTINGEEVEENDGVFAYTVSAKENLAQVAVAYTIHPLATATPASGFNVDVPTAGDPANTQVITVTAEDGTEKEYTVSVAKAAALSTDATLKALSVEGFELTPAFDSEVIEYTITKAYEAELPATTKVTAETNDANATVVVSYDAEVKNQINIVVTAEDEKTSKEYHIAVLSAEAVKSLSRVLFSNGFDAFIDNTNRTVKAFYLNGTEAPTATTITAGANCTAGEIVDGKIVVTGADETLAEYVVTLEAVAANTNVVEETAEAGAFDGTETWVKAGLYMSNPAGFNEGKYVLRRGLREGETDQRVIAGWVRAYFFVGNASNASKFEMAVTGNKPLKYAVDGGAYTAVDADNISIALGTGNHMIEIVTNQTKGDCNLSAPKLVKDDATALGNTEAEVKAVKRIVNGQLLIEKNGVLYNAQGAVIR